MAKPSAAQATNEAYALDLSTYTRDQLVEVLTGLMSEIEARKAQEIEEFRAKVQESAMALGLSIEELVGLPRKRQTKNGSDERRLKSRERGSADLN